MVFCNISPEDIILKEEIDAFAKAHPDRFKVTYVVDKAGADWKGPTGYLTVDLVKKYMPELGSEGNKVFVCAPPGTSHLSESQIVSDRIVLFLTIVLNRFLNSHDEACQWRQGTQIHSG